MFCDIGLTDADDAHVAHDPSSELVSDSSTRKVYPQDPLKRYRKNSQKLLNTNQRARCFAAQQRRFDLTGPRAVENADPESGHTLDQRQHVTDLRGHAARDIRAL